MGGHWGRRGNFIAGPAAHQVGNCGKVWSVQKFLLRSDVRVDAKPSVHTECHIMRRGRQHYVQPVQGNHIDLSAGHNIQYAQAAEQNVWVLRQHHRPPRL